MSFCRTVLLSTFLMSAMLPSSMSLYAQDKGLEPTEKKIRKTPVVPPTGKAENKEAVQLYKEAQFLIQDGWEEGAINYAKVEGKLRDSISKDPSYTPAYMLLGKTFEDRQDLKGAENVYREASRNSLDKESGFLGLARIYILTGRGNDAHKVLDSVLVRSPFHAEAKALLASMLRREGDLVGAEQMLRDALGHSADSTAIYKELALVYLQNKKYPLARLSLLKATKLKEDDATIHNTMGLLNLKEGNENKAAESFKHAIEIDEQYLPAHMNLSALYLKHGYFEKAMNELKTSERLKAKDTTIITSLGVAYRGMNDYSKAEESFKRALDIDRNYQPAIFNLGVLYYRYIGDRNRAASFFKTYGSGKQVASSNAAGIEDVTSYLDRIELSISKQAEINLMENRETDALGRFERAVALRQNTQRRLRELDAATGELSNKRSEIEKQSDAIDKQSNDSRNKRFDAEKRLASTITAMSEGRSQISKADNKLQEAHGRIMALQGKRQTVSQEIETLFGSRGAIRKDKRNVDSQLRDLEKKFSLVPAKDLQASLEDIDRQLDKLDDRYRSNAGDLNGLQSERERLVGKLGKLVSLSQDVNQHRAGNDTEFNQRTKELFEVEKALDDDYNEMRSIEKNRDKFETSIQNNMKSLAEFEQQTAETEAQLHTLIANRDLDNSLLNLDKQREAGGVKLETYEQQRDALVQNMEDNSKQVRAKRDQLREIGKKWDQVVDQSASLHDKINALEDERAQIATKNIDLLDKRKRARFLIDEVLRKRNNIDSATDKIEKQLAEHLTKMVAFDVKWAGLVKQRNDLVDEITTLEKRREQIWDSLGKARLAAGSSLNDQISAKEYREKLQDQLVVYDRLKQATSSWLQKMHDLQAVEQQWRTVASEVDDHLKERKQLADKWFEKRQQRDQLLLERNKSDQITVTLREQRDKLEEQRLAVENKRKDFLQTRQKMKSDQTQQLSAELALEQELLEQADKRRDAVRRDLLKEFNEKNPGRAMQSTKADLVSPVINPNAKAPSGKNNGKKARGK